MYTRFTSDDRVPQEGQELVTSTWSNNLNNLQVGFTSSAQADFSSPTGSGHFFVEVYQTASTDSDGKLATEAEVQYAVSYGHRHGSGSPNFTNDVGSLGVSATRVIYNQYRQLVFNDDTKLFTFGSHTPESIYVININRSRYKQKLTLGSLNLHISGNSVSVAAEDPAVGIKLTDDSVTTGTNYDTSFLGPVFRIVSGTNGVVSGSNINQLTINASASNYGNFYPESGIIILNADAFSGSLHPGHGHSGSSEAFDQNKLNARMLRHIDAANNFIVDTTEEINSTFYFCRALNSQYNYTNNESFVDGNKNIRFQTMQLNPKVFITTVGLYNDAFELMAIAKLSQPVAKDFTKEALIRVKLDY